MKMEIKSIKRPWDKQVKQGTRYAPDKFYQSREWKQTRSAFLASAPLIDLPAIHHVPYQNKFCVECWKKGKIVDGHSLDHQISIKMGGHKTDFNNLAFLCKKCHAQKSSNEGKQIEKL